MTGACQDASRERESKEANVREEPKLQSHRIQYDWCIHVAGVIGYEHVAALGVELFKAGDAAVDGADCEQHARPFLCDAVLREAGAVAQRCQKGDGAHQDGGGDDRGCGKEGCSDFPHDNEVRMKVETLLCLP